MRTLTSAIGVLLFACVVAVAQVAVVPITDASPSASPIHNTGTVTLSQVTLPSGMVTLSHKDNWTVKNVSNKPVMAFVESLRMVYASGYTIERNAKYEAFFGPNGILAPGINFDGLLSIESSRTEPGRKADSLQRQPECEATVRWVQFADGTTFGDSGYGEQFLADRSAIWSALRRLKHVYAADGVNGFARQLEQRAAEPGVDAYLAHLRDLQQKRGPQKAIEALQEHLAAAEERAAELHEETPN